MEEKTRLRDITGLLKVTMMDLELATHIFLAPEHSLPGPLGAYFLPSPLRQGLFPESAGD